MNLPAILSGLRVGFVVFCLSASCALATTNMWYPSASTNYDNWPTNWVAIPSLNDPNDGKDVSIDLVGDALNPCGYWSANNEYFFIRMRVAVSNVAVHAFTDSHLVYIDRIDFTNGATAGQGMPDYAFAWDSKMTDVTKHGLELLTGSNLAATATWSGIKLDDIDGKAADKTAPPDFNLSGDGYLRTIDQRPTTNFGLTTLIDFAVKWSFLQANTALNSNQQWRIQFGSINNANDHNFPDDIAGGFSPASIVTNSYSAILSSSNQVPAAASVLVRAYEGSDGVVVEFETIQEAGQNDIVLYLQNDGEWVEVGRCQPTGKGDHLYQFNVPGLKAGDLCNLMVRDDEGKYHTTYNLPVGNFATQAVLMENNGLWLHWKALPDRTYDIYRANQPEGPWTLVRSLTAITSATRAFVSCEPGKPSGFFKIVQR